METANGSQSGNEFYKVREKIYFCLFQSKPNDLLEENSYNLSFQAQTVPSIILLPNTSCTAMDCQYQIDLTLFQLNTNISVLLTASNVVGESKPSLCNAQPISKNEAHSDASEESCFPFFLVFTSILTIPLIQGFHFHIL